MNSKNEDLDSKVVKKKVENNSGLSEYQITLFTNRIKNLTQHLKNNKKELKIYVIPQVNLDSVIETVPLLQETLSECSKLAVQANKMWVKVLAVSKKPDMSIDNVYRQLIRVVYRQLQVVYRPPCLTVSASTL